MSVFLLLQWSEAVTHSEVPKLRVSAGGWVWGLGVSDAPLKLNWSSGLWNGHLGLRWSCRRRGLALCAPPPCEEAPKEQEQQLLGLKGALQLPYPELSWRVGDCQTCALKPSSFCPHMWQAVSRMTGQQSAREWFSHLAVKHFQAQQETHGSVWLQGASSVPPVPTPQKSREKSCCLCRDWQGCSWWHSACAQHALHWPLSPCPTTGGVIARVCH